MSIFENHQSDASNNKWLISGKGALIMNPPSAWAVAKRDAPQVAEQLWTHGFAAGPKGRFAPYLPTFWTIWAFSKNKEAAKSLLVHLSRRHRLRSWWSPATAMTCRPMRS
jgi:ABC-type glycerol-3-phosphate transport system substrate-binding protein